jgi:ElaB/YqjD/DUF883 family membrane-anchored ribosome-binding protein
MLSDTEVVLRDLQHLTRDLEKLLTHSSSNITSHTEEALATCHNTLQTLQGRLSQLPAQTRRRIADVAKSAQKTLRGNLWRSVMLAAAAGFLLGLALSAQHESRS